MTKLPEVVVAFVALTAGFLAQGASSRSLAQEAQTLAPGTTGSITGTWQILTVSKSVDGAGNTSDGPSANLPMSLVQNGSSVSGSVFVSAVVGRIDGSNITLTEKKSTSVELVYHGKVIDPDHMQGTVSYNLPGITGTWTARRVTP